MKTTQPPTKQRISALLVSAADDMRYIAQCMDHYSADAQFFEHAREIRGAADLMRQWSKQMMSNTDIEHVHASPAEHHKQTVRDLIYCCRAWEPAARILGNVRAEDAAAALFYILPMFESEEKQ